MSEKDNDLPRLRDAFSKCKNDLVKRTDFDVMYKYLIDTDIGKKRMSCVFILRGGDSSLTRSRELYDAIYKEDDECFVHWFDAIKRALSRTANGNNGQHQEVLETINIAQDAPQVTELSTTVKRPRAISPSLMSSTVSSCMLVTVCVNYN